MRDSDVRNAIIGELNSKYRDDPKTRIVEEMGIWSGAVRIDVAVINGEMVGYELKSNSDTLQRLPYQIEIYGKVFDRMTLVVGDRLAEAAVAMIPKWWGCKIAKMVDGQVRLTTKRKSRRNPSPDPDIVLQLLWKDEAVAVLEQHGLDKGWRSKKSSEISQRLLSKVPFTRLSAHVRDALRARDKLGQLRPC